MTTPPRIALAGIAIESSTFTPYRSGAADFEVRRGTAEILDRFPFFTDGSESGRRLRDAAEYVGVLHARALPGGQLDREVYEGWKKEIVDGLAATMAETPLDGFFFDVHGAMSVVGLDDAEGDLITAIRAVIGPEVVVGTAMDLHGNVSHTLFEACDLMTCYRHAPLIDAWETRERGLRDLVEVAARVRDGGARPHKALVHVPILLPGEKTSTRIEPAKSLYARIPELTEREGVTDVSYWIGFAWADQPRCKAAIVAFGDGAEAVEEAALELATAVWEARHVSLGTRFAIKFIESEYANSQEARARFDREARAAATLPADIRAKLTRRRKAGEQDAATDPLTQPDVRQAVLRASFEALVGFQLTDEQLRYNATR